MRLFRKYSLEIAGFLALLSILLLTISLIFPDSYGICQKSEHTGHESCSGSYPAIIFLFLSAAKVIQDYNGLFVAVFTGFLVITTLQQRDISKRQVLHFERSERAWLYPKDFDFGVIRPADENTAIHLQMEWVNHSNTPAIKVWVHSKFVILPGDIPSDFDFDKELGMSAGTARKNMTYVGPKGHTGSVAHIIKPEEFIKTVASEQRMFFFGKVEYEDIFDTSVQRQTTYLWELIGYVGHPIRDPQLRFMYRRDDRYSRLT